MNVKGGFIGLLTHWLFPVVIGQEITDAYLFIEMKKRIDKFLSTLCLNLEKRFVLEKAKTEIKYKNNGGLVVISVISIDHFSDFY